MKTATHEERLEVINCMAETACDDVRQDVIAGLTAPQKYLPSKYFYDGRGSELFERICRLPEYYQTRTELSILKTNAGDIMRGLRAGNLIELGSGANWKIRTLLDAADGTRPSIRYVPVDVCEPALVQAAEDLLERYPDLAVTGIVADFHRDMDRIMSDDDKLITFFGSTIGNFREAESSRFLQSIAGAMKPRDRFLLGVDMIKEREMLEAAYNDAQGVTAEFNKNILEVMNRELNASFDLSHFDHLALYNEDQERMEMHLRANRNISADIRGIGLRLTMKEGETIHTEVCRKFSKEKITRMSAEAGLRITRWFTDSNGWFAIVEFMTEGAI